MEQIIGIVGAGEDKFTPESKAYAKIIIRALLAPADTGLTSGHSPMGGIDLWAEDIATEMGRRKIIHAPEVFSWNPPGKYGFKARNLDIAKDGNPIHVFVVKDYPETYTGRRFNLCYHCMGTFKDLGTSILHVKSGGCWTAINAIKMGHGAVWHIIEGSIEEVDLSHG